jgi:hypothetical protein
MKIAVFCDIHSNIHAFQAAPKDAGERDVTYFFFLGT